MLRLRLPALALSALFLVASGCSLYSGGGGDDDDCAYPPTTGGGAPLSLRNPQTGQCEYYGGGDWCDPACGVPCPLAGATDYALPSWGYCDSYCSGLDENTCLDTDGCRGAYVDFCPPNADCGPGLNAQFVECWAVDQTGPVRGGGCTGLDAWTCSTHDDCRAIHENACLDGTGPGCTGNFLACADEPTNPNPGNCYGPITCAADPPDCPSGSVAGRANGCYTGYCIPSDQCEAPAACNTLGESACVDRADCQALYQGLNCTCDAAGNCTCADWVFDRCEGNSTASLIEAEDANLVSTSDGWAVFHGGGLHNGEGLGTISDNSSASLGFNFTGTSLVVYYETGPNRGKFTVTVDNGQPVVVDGYAPGDFSLQVPVTIAQGLAQGSHSVVLQCVAGSGYCAPDYFTFGQPDVLPPTF